MTLFLSDPTIPVCAPDDLTSFTSAVACDVCCDQVESLVTLLTQLDQLVSSNGRVKGKQWQRITALLDKDELQVNLSTGRDALLPLLPSRLLHLSMHVFVLPSAHHVC